MKWISVEDRLPLDENDIKGGVYDDVEVLVNRPREICTTTFRVGSTPVPWGCFDLLDIDHWMPLPNPPD